MAHPADSGSKGPTAFAGGRLSPEDAERFASMFRPSWELDEAPFTGPGTLSTGDMRALAGGGVHADVRATAGNMAHAPNGTHAPAAPQQSSEPENSVVIDRSITAQDLAPPAPPRPVAVKGSQTILGMAAPTGPHAAASTQAATPFVQPPAPASGSHVAAAPAHAPITQAQAPVAPPQAAPVSRPPPPSQRPVAPPFNLPPPMSARARPVSVDLEDIQPKKSKMPLFVGLGVGGVAALGLVIWLATSSGGGEKSASPAPTETQKVDDKVSSVPPPLPQRRRPRPPRRRPPPPPRRPLPPPRRSRPPLRRLLPPPCQSRPSLPCRRPQPPPRTPRTPLLAPIRAAGPLPPVPAASPRAGRRSCGMCRSDREGLYTRPVAGF